MSSLYADYQVALYSPTGVRLAIIDDYRSLQYQRSLNNTGFFTLIMDGRSSKVSLFENNAHIEIKRKIPGVKNWYTDFVGIAENFDFTLFQNGNYQFTCVGSGLNRFLASRIIAYRDATAQSNKADVSETVMKEYVKENAGSDATVLNSRLADGVLSNLSVEADGGSGDAWSGERSGKPLLATLQDISNFASIDFAVETNTTIGTYIFRTFDGQLGEDRTTSGLDSSTGKNAAGNSPHIFAPERGNVQTSRVIEKHRKESNRVFAFGKGSGAGRSIEYSENAISIGTGNINLKEVMRGAGSQDIAAELERLASEWLDKLITEERFEFSPQDIESSLYGVHYTFGDKVTVKVGDVERDKKIISVSISIGERGESDKKIVFEDVVR